MPPKEYTWTFKSDGNPLYIGQLTEEKDIEETPPEYRDDWENNEEQIRGLKDRINSLKHKISYLQGKCEAQETFWKISNGEE